MRIVITGSNGFLAQKFCELVHDRGVDYAILGLSKSINRNIYLNDDSFLQIDLTDFVSLQYALDDFQPTHILHAAAVTTIEACESDREQALLTNVELTKYLSTYCEENGLHLTFLSTDFVFDGANGPYKEEDATNPLSFYGETKVMAEQAVTNSGAKASIIRTILVYGVTADSSRKNLVLWAKGELEQNHLIKVVCDQWRMPTWVDDLAEACLLAMKQQAEGIYHISGEELMTIEEAVLIIADTLGLDKSLVSPICSKDIGHDTNRPRKTGFDLTKSCDSLNYIPTSFVNSLTYICKQLERYGR